MRDTVKRFNHYADIKTYLNENSTKIIYWLCDAQAKNELIIKSNMMNRGDPDWDWLVIWRSVEI